MPGVPAVVPEGFCFHCSRVHGEWVKCEHAAPDLTAVGEGLEERVKQTLSALEKTGLSAREADEFIRDCVFNAWWDWDYSG